MKSIFKSHDSFNGIHLSGYRVNQELAAHRLRGREILVSPDYRQQLPINSSERYDYRSP